MMTVDVKKILNKAIIIIIIISFIELLGHQLQRPISLMTLVIALLLHNGGHGNSMVSGQRHATKITLHIEAYSERGIRMAF